MNSERGRVAIATSPMCAVVFVAGLMVGSALAQDGTSDEVVSLPPPADVLLACTSTTLIGGREEPTPDAPALTFPDGRHRILEPDAESYGTIAAGDAWIDLFATPAGHGATEIGFVPLIALTCAPYEG